MFIATAPTPKEDIEQSKASEDFLHLFGRACEYLEELEKMNKIEKGVHISFHEKMTEEAEKIFKEKWSK